MSEVLYDRHKFASLQVFSHLSVCFPDLFQAPKFVPNNPWPHSLSLLLRSPSVCCCRPPSHLLCRIRIWPSGLVVKRTNVCHTTLNSLRPLHPFRAVVRAQHRCQMPKLQSSSLEVLLISSNCCKKHNIGVAYCKRVSEKHFS